MISEKMKVPMRPHWFEAIALIQTMVYVAKVMHAKFMEDAKAQDPKHVFNDRVKRIDLISVIKNAIRYQTVAMSRPTDEVVQIIFDDTLWLPGADNRFWVMRILVAVENGPEYFVFEIDFRKPMHECVTLVDANTRMLVDVFQIEFEE